MTLNAALSANITTATHSHLNGTHSSGLVAVSFGLATLGSFAALASAARIRSAKGAKRLGWVAVTAIALGGGAIWSMHFVGTVTYHAYSDITLDFGVTLLSAGIAVGVAGIGLGVVAADPFNPGRLVGGGVFAGFGITAMHYPGWRRCVPRGPSTTTSCSWCSRSRWRCWPRRRRSGSPSTSAAPPGSASRSTVMAATICGVHYTGMAAMRLDYDPGLRPKAGADPFALATTTAFASVIVLMFIVFAALGGVVEPTFAVKRIPRPDAEDADQHAGCDPYPSLPLPLPLPRPSRPTDVIDSSRVVASSRVVESSPVVAPSPPRPATTTAPLPLLRSGVR